MTTYPIGEAMTERRLFLTHSGAFRWASEHNPYPLTQPRLREEWARRFWLRQASLWLGVQIAAIAVAFVALVLAVLS